MFKYTGKAVGRRGCGDPVPESSLVRHREFYERKIRAFEGMLEDFDESAAEKVLKILSVTGEYADRKKKQVKASIWSNLKRASKKAPKTEDFIFEKKIAEQKLEKLKKSLVSGEGLVAGIRPERFKIEKCDASADMNVQGGFIVQPTVCELLGGRRIQRAFRLLRKRYGRANGRKDKNQYKRYGFCSVFRGRHLFV